jgi:hypothetical protein
MGVAALAVGALRPGHSLQSFLVPRKVFPLLSLTRQPL